MVRTVTRKYETISGETVNAEVLMIPAVVKTIGKSVRKNSNEKEWRLCQADIKMPDGSTKTVPAQLFEASYELHSDLFAKGEEIELEVQTDGDYKGYAKMQLPEMERIDVDAFKALLTDVNEKI